MHTRRLVRSLVVACAAAALIAGRGADARAVVSGDAAVLGAAIQAYVDSLPEPQTKAARRLLTKLQALVAKLNASPTSLSDEFRRVIQAYQSLPKPVATDPQIDLAADGVRAALAGRLAEALDAFEASLAEFGDPSPAPVAAIRNRIAQARTKLAIATDVLRTDGAAFAALGAAVSKFDVAVAKLAAYEDSLDVCGPVVHGDGILGGSVEYSIDGAPSAEVGISGGLGSGTPDDSYYGIGTSADASNLSFTVRGVPIRAGLVVPATNAYDFDHGARVYFSRDGKSFVCDTGEMRITAIALRNYPAPRVQPYPKYVVVKGTFTGSGADVSHGSGERATITFDFSCCEIPYHPR